MKLVITIDCENLRSIPKSIDATVGNVGVNIPTVSLQEEHTRLAVATPLTTAIRHSLNMLDDAIFQHSELTREIVKKFG